MTAQEKDRIECAIRHIKTSADVDPWAVEIAVEAMEKQIPKQPNNCIWYGDGSAMGHCPMCDTFLDSDSDAHCGGCGQAIDWTEGE